MNFNLLLSFFLGLILHLSHSFLEVKAQSLPSSSEMASCSIACGDLDDGRICASNGVSYKNSCRYDCAKRRNTRLRIIQRGKCENLTIRDYKKAQKKLK